MPTDANTNAPTPPSEAPTPLRVIDLGLISYADAYARQVDEVRRVLDSRAASTPGPHVGTLLLLEHPPVITISRRHGAASHLKASPELLARHGVRLEETDRGGDITYHGPGQLVAYPILDLNRLRLRLHDYLRLLEEIVIELCSACGIEAHRDPAATGVWIHPIHPGEPDAKICAMGVRIRQWVSMHGLAINVTTNLNHFDLIVPCGLADRRVTSLSNILAEKSPSIERVKSMLAERFQLMVSARLALPDPANQVPPLTQA